MDSVGLSGQVSCTDIAFRIGPRINAAGRIKHADTAFQLLITEDVHEAYTLSGELNSYNQERQRLERKLLSEVTELLRSAGDRSAHILYSEGWQKGILGLVASKAVECSNCPVILLSREGDMLIGSGRAPDEIDLFSAISACGDLLERFGGHRSAAGLRIGIGKIDEFRERFCREVSMQAIRAVERPPLNLDAEVELEELASDDYVRFLELLEPFGPGYECPLFFTRDFCVRGARVVGQNHLKLALTPRMSFGNHKSFDLLAWGHGNKIDVAWDSMELAFIPSVNTWNGKKNLQLILKDARKP